MEISVSKALEKAIEKFIAKKTNLVALAQSVGKKIIENGLIDTEVSMPFQILPTELFDEDRDLICKIILYLDHPMYGFFSIELLDESCAVTCPNTYIESYKVMSHKEFDQWLNELITEMERFFNFAGEIISGSVSYSEKLLNDLLNDYHQKIKPHLTNIKEKINSNNKIAIISNNFYALVTDAKSDYTKALLIPPAWVVFKDLDNLPDQNESIDDYIDEEETNKLFEELNTFFKLEGYLAAPIYLAQRICLQNGFNINGYSISNETWEKAHITEDSGEYVLPAIDTSEFVITT